MNLSNLPISKTASQIHPFHVMKILGEAKKLASEGKDIIHMEIGEPDFPSLDCVNDAAHQATIEGKTHYTPTLGLPELRTKLARNYKTYFNADVSAARIAITPGSSSGLFNVLTAILNPGDAVMMSDPSYPCNRQFVHLLHGEVNAIPVDETTQFQLNCDLIETNWKEDIKAVMVATPSNPTGTLIEQTELMKMAQFLAKKNAYLIVDEIYQGLVYERPAETILANKNLPENVIVINSFSKFFGMTGWRLGWCVLPEHLVPIFDRLGQNLYLSAPTPSQYGALRVLEKDALEALEQRRKTFEARRHTLIAEMLKAGFHLPLLPQGGFYLYWDVSEFTENSEAFALALLHSTGVAVTPGKDFGKHKAAQYIRLTYTNHTHQLVEAVKRIKRFCHP